MDLQKLFTPSNLFQLTGFLIITSIVLGMGWLLYGRKSRFIIPWLIPGLWLRGIIYGKKDEQRKRHELLDPAYTVEVGKKLLATGFILIMLIILFILEQSSK